MVLGIFAALFTLFTAAPWTLIEPAVLFRVFIGLCFIGNLLPYIRFGWRMGMERLEWFLFNLLAVGPWLTCILLWLNYLGHGPVTTADHGVASVDQHGGVLYYHFTDGYLQEYPHARAIFRDLYPIIGDRMHVSLATGLLGVPVVVRKAPFVSGP